ncbi:MAG: sensor histidine kinase [Dehalococcoidia bacterium]|nr:MAG: sensor histidine kinase [Dehalococcoidia bacterium]
MNVRLLRSWWYWPAAGSPGRTFLTSVLVLTTGALFVGALLIGQDFRSHRKAVIDHASEEAARAAYEVDQLIGSRLSILRAIASAPSFRDNNLDAARQYLARLDAAALGFDGLVFFVDPSGMIQASTDSPGLKAPPELPLDITARPYWRPPLESGEAYVGAAFMGVLSPPRPVLPLLVPVRDWAGNVTGLVGGTLLLEPLSRDIAFAPGIDAEVVDREGQLIVRGGLPTSPTDVSRDPLYARMRTAGNGVFVDVTGLDQKPDELVGFATARPAGWTIIWAQPLQAALAPLVDEAALQFGVLLGGLVAGLALANWVARAVNRAEAAERAVLRGEHIAREAAEATLQEREQEVENICHDLRSPLSVIYGSAVYLRRRVARAQPVTTPVLEEMVSEIETSASRLDAMIQEMLDAAQLQAGHSLVLNRNSGDLTEILRQAVAEQKRSRALDIRVNVDRAIVGEWDGPRMRRVFGNLLSNALKFSPDGSEVTVSASIEVDSTGDRALVQVRDRGIGIPQRDLPHIFERFARGTNTAGIAGTGVGLAATRHLVELHGGTIDVRSQEGEGSTFLVRLPLSYSAEAAATEAQLA